MTSVADRSEPGDHRTRVAPDLRRAAHDDSPLERLADLAEDGFPLALVVPRLCGRLSATTIGVPWQHPTPGDPLAAGGLTVGLTGASIADLLPPAMIGPSVRGRGDVDLHTPDTDAHLLAAPVDAALVRAEVEAVLAARRIAVPYASPDVVDRLLGCFGFRDAAVDGSRALDDADRAILLRLLPFLSEIMGTTEGADLALRAVLGVPATVECRQPRLTVVPLPLRTLLGRAVLGVDFVPGIEFAEANGYLVTLGPMPVSVLLRLREPAQLRKVATILDWLLPQGGATELRYVLAVQDRRVMPGARQPNAVLGLTTWTPPPTEARSSAGERS